MGLIFSRENNSIKKSFELGCNSNWFSVRRPKNLGKKTQDLQEDFIVEENVDSRLKEMYYSAFLPACLPACQPASQAILMSFFFFLLLLAWPQYYSVPKQARRDGSISKAVCGPGKENTTKESDQRANRKWKFPFRYTVDPGRLSSIILFFYYAFQRFILDYYFGSWF